MPGPNKQHAIQKPRNLMATLKRVFKYMREYRFLLLLAAILILMSSVAQIAGTFMLKPMIDTYIGPLIGKSNPDLSGFIAALLAMAAVYIIGAFATWAYNRILIKVSTGTLYKIRTELFSHMMTLPIKYFDTHTHGELMSRFTNDTDALRDMLSQSFAQMVSSTVMVTGVFISMLILSPILTLVVILMLFVMLFVVKKLASKSGMYFAKQQKAIGEVNGYIEEMIEGQKVVKIFNHEEEANEGFEKLNENLFEASKGANTYSNVLMPIMGNLSYAQYALTAILGGILMIYTNMGLGTLASFLQFTRSFSQPITQISQQFNAILYAIAGAERIFDMLDEKSEEDNGYVTLVHAKYDENGTLTECASNEGILAWKHPHHDGSVTYHEMKGDVRFSDVVFGYEENKIVLNGITLYAKPGQKIAFVGSTGAGKTTITNLINRFYDVPDGKIRYDGININKIKKPDLRRSMSMVLQDTHLFEGTVMDNIRYGRLTATDEECIAAAKLANADFFIRHLSDGYDTDLSGDGQNLSQGQRQLLAIARAAVANPPVLILDEATSSIDTRTEALIEKGMDNLMRGKTVFVIAHRLSTVRNSDAIMVLEHGKIIERGDHEELLQQKGRYFQLYTGMFELS